MKRRLYSEEEIELLKKCKFVLDVKYGCQIEYDPIFKVWCIMMKFECPELTAKEIFERAGMNTNLLHKTTPRRRIADWIYSYKRYGLEYFLKENEPYILTDDFKRQLYNILKEKFN